MTVQTKISPDEQLLKQVDAAARGIRISRDQFFVLAIEEFLKRSENKRLSIAINHVYENSPLTEEDEAQLEAMRRYYARTLEHEEW